MGLWSNIKTENKVQFYWTRKDFQIALREPCNDLANKERLQRDIKEALHLDTKQGAT